MNRMIQKNVIKLAGRKTSWVQKKEGAVKNQK